MAPSRGTLTGTSQIHVVVEPLSGLSAGGSNILSYQIDMKTADSETWTELKGYTTNDASLEAISTGLQISTQYSVRYRAKNIHGWGPYSDIQEILTITAPDVIE